MAKPAERKIVLKVADTANQEVLVGFIGSMSNAIIKTVIYNDVLSSDDAFMNISLTLTKL